MQTIKTFLRTFGISVGMFFVCATAVHAEVIRDFTSMITVSPDSSITVEEKIVYDFEVAQRHGIFRTIPLQNAKGEDTSIDDISVTDEQGQSYQFTKSTSNGVFTIKIGDPHMTITGLKEYDITYRVKNAVGYFDGYDEIYWNVTGNQWQVAIEKATATVVLPNDTAPLQQACYYGPKGNTTTCTMEMQNVFAAPSVLSPGGGLTIAVGFPKELVAVYHVPPQSKIVKIAKIYWPVLLPIFIFIFMFKKWYRKGRDAKGSGIITAQYDTVDNLTPLEAAVIINQQVHQRDIVAEIICLATKGYISITKTEDKSFLSKKIDYVLRLEKLPGDELSAADTRILYTLFSNDYVLTGFKNMQQVIDLFKKGISPSPQETLTLGTEVVLSKCRQLMGITQFISPVMKKRLVDGGYYTADFAKGINISGKLVAWGLLGALFLVFNTKNIFTRIESTGGVTAVVVLIASIFVAVGIAIVFSKIMPAKTAKGVKTEELLLGLKEYIKVAEKDRIDFHNAPEKNPALFEHLLPYAMVFEQEKKWAKAFESIMSTSPSWYRGDTSAFNAVLFTSSIDSHFSSLFHSASSTSGGSGGGGSSGGGGGGGGGGSW